jgi:DNA-binding response OmpR family regulator
MARSVLIVEDETDIAKLIQWHLEELSCTVRVAFSGGGGLCEAEAGCYDLIILDLMLPEIDGLEIARRLRRKSIRTPILMLTAKSSEIDQMLAFESGVEDYLTKPFGIVELHARVLAIFRRIDAFASAAALATMRVGDLTIDPSTRKVILRGKSVLLARKEFDLLHHLARNPDRVYTRAELAEVLWWGGYDGYEYAVNRHINRLRSWIEVDPAKPEYVLSVRGAGYKLGCGESTRSK